MNNLNMGHDKGDANLQSSLLNFWASMAQRSVQSKFWRDECLYVLHRSIGVHGKQPVTKWHTSTSLLK